MTVTIWSICLMLGNLSESMRRQAGTDQLTGLLNRNGFQTAALRERALADRTGSPLTLAVLKSAQRGDVAQVAEGELATRGTLLPSI